VPRVRQSPDWQAGSHSGEWRSRAGTAAAAPPPQARRLCHSGGARERGPGVSPGALGRRGPERGVMRRDAHATSDGAAGDSRFHGRDGRATFSAGRERGPGVPPGSSGAPESATRLVAPPTTAGRPRPEARPPVGDSGLRTCLRLPPPSTPPPPTYRLLTHRRTSQSSEFRVRSPESGVGSPVVPWSRSPVVLLPSSLPFVSFVPFVVNSPSPPLPLLSPSAYLRALCGSIPSHPWSSVSIRGSVSPPSSVRVLRAIRG